MKTQNEINDFLESHPEITCFEAITLLLNECKSDLKRLTAPVPTGLKQKCHGREN